MWKIFCHCWKPFQRSQQCWVLRGAQLREGLGAAQWFQPGLIQGSCSGSATHYKHNKHIILGQQSCATLCVPSTKSTLVSHLQHPDPPQTLLEPHTRSICFTPEPASQYPHQNSKKHNSLIFHERKGVSQSNGLTVVAKQSNPSEARGDGRPHTTSSAAEAPKDPTLSPAPQLEHSLVGFFFVFVLLVAFLFGSGLVL